MWKKKIIVSWLIAICLITQSISIVKADDIEEEEVEEIELQNTIVEVTSQKVIEEPILSSKAAVVYDRTTGQMIWGKNENEKRAMASTTKIMTAMIVLEKANLKDVVTV